MRSQDLGFLRPLVCKSIRSHACRRHRPQYARFSAAVAVEPETKKKSSGDLEPFPVLNAPLGPETEPEPAKGREIIREIELARIKELERGCREAYPRIGRDVRSMTCKAFRKRYESLKCEESCEDEVVTIHGRCVLAEQKSDRIWQLICSGRISSSRVAGIKLAFLDITQDGQTVQGMCNFRRLQTEHISALEFQTFLRLIRRGDNISQLIHRSIHPLVCHC